jgi:hypothetical protein
MTTAMTVLITRVEVPKTAKARSMTRRSGSRRSETNAGNPCSKHGRVGGRDLFTKIQTMKHLTSVMKRVDVKNARRMAHAIKSARIDAEDGEGRKNNRIGKKLRK